LYLFALNIMLITRINQVKKVYELFKREKVLDMLCDDYEDLHGMSMEYMMQFIDQYLGGKLAC